jgi:hypothetical protein
MCMPQKQKEQTKSTPARAGESSARDDGAKALRAELLIKFELVLVRNAAACYERGEIARRDIAFVGHQRLPFEQLSPALQGEVVKSATVLRSNLNAELSDWRGTLRELLRRFARSLFEINPNRAWVESELAIARTALTEKSWYWLMIACDGKPTEHGWRAPGWSEGWPSGISAKGALAVERLDDEQSLAVLKAFGERVAKSFDLAQESALNQVKVLAAKNQGSAHATIRPPSLNKVKMRIAIIKRNHPGASIEKICHLLDGNNDPILAAWKKPEMRSWHEAWANPEFRHRVKSYIAKIPPAAKD